MGNGKAAPNQQADLSDPSPNADRPPRLATCINERIVEPNRTPAGDNSWALAEGEALAGHHLEAILDWVATALEDDAGFEAVWETPAGEHPNPAEVSANPEGENEETWAKLIETLFLGAAYGGPDVVASFPSNGRIGSAGYKYLLERFIQWDGDEVSLEDPAHSLVVSCQHLTTYGALARGLRLDSDLANNGIPAHQAACSLPIFDGAWFSPRPIKVAGIEIHLGPSYLNSQDAHNANRVSSIAPGFGPGTIYTYNPALLNEFVLGEVPWFELARDQNGNVKTDPDSGLPLVDRAASQKRLLAAQQATKEDDRASAAAAATLQAPLKAVGIDLNYKPEKTEIFAGVQQQAATLVKGMPGVLKGMLGIEKALLPTVVQLEGCHVSMVLRRYTLSDGKTQAVQLLDTTAHTQPAAGNASKESIAKDYIAFANVSQYRGIFAGEGHTEIKGTRGYFVGLGNLPAIKSPNAVFENLRRARPVGLARLILAKRERSAPLQDDDIYFVSRMIPTWGTSTPYQNYNIARLLWSLRNTPYRREVQAYWVVYAPRGPLAEAMWNSGARELSLDEITLDALERANSYRPPDTPKWTKLWAARDLLAVAVLSHDQGGQALELWRDHALKGGSGEGTLPKVIRELFVQTGAPPVSLILKRQGELEKARDDEIARRKRRQREKEQQRDAAIKRAQKGDAAAREEIHRLNAEIRAIWAEPFPEREALFDWSKKPLEDKAERKVVTARNHPDSSYLHADFAGGHPDDPASSLALPGLFV